ncbi:hypothetical protein D3C72_2177850 [compost metagenome]
MQALAHVVIEPRQDLLAAIDERRLDAEAMEDIGEFHRDITAAGNHDPARQLLQMEGLVRGNAVFVAR